MAGRRKENDKKKKEERMTYNLTLLKCILYANKVCCVLVLYQVNMQGKTVEFNTGDFKLANFSVIV